jgi:3'-phosphoadenosine 5'-phosphosulfate sulfotransferase (PAPS reductase)/FAD synthetase
MTKLITETVKKAQLWAKNWPRSVVLWSGGKDSTAMLHLLRFKAEIDIPVIQFRQPKFRERYAYSDRLIKEWDLTVFEYPASRYALADGPDGEPKQLCFR